MILVDLLWARIILNSAFFMCVTVGRTHDTAGIVALPICMVGVIVFERHVAMYLGVVRLLLIKSRLLSLVAGAGEMQVQLISD